MANKYEEIVKQEWKNFNEEKKLLPNIMLLGASGCGKSSLINLVFKENLATVNDASRGTTDFDIYKGSEWGLGVNLIDSRGYELENGKEESFAEYINAIKNEIDKRGKEPMAKIHIIWYCMSITAKFQEYDNQTLKMLRNDPELRKRVCVVLTKCDQDDEEGSTAKKFKNIIAEDVGSSMKTFEVSTNPNVFLELEDMIEWSVEQLDDQDMKEAFVLSQNISLKEKRKAAGIKIAFYAAAAAAIGATPIPVADAALLTPLQLMMAAHIIRIYGIDSFTNITKGVIGSLLIPSLGKAFAGGLLKLIPGVGQVVGGIINGTVASSITTALGCAISQICFVCCEKILKGEEIDTGSIFSTENIENAMRIVKNLSDKSGENIYISNNEADKSEIDKFSKTYIYKSEDKLEELKAFEAQYK